MTIMDAIKARARTIISVIRGRAPGLVLNDKDLVLIERIAAIEVKLELGEYNQAEIESEDK